MQSRITAAEAREHWPRARRRPDVAFPRRANVGPGFELGSGGQPPAATSLELTVAVCSYRLRCVAASRLLWGSGVASLVVSAGGSAAMRWMVRRF